MINSRFKRYIAAAVLLLAVVTSQVVLSETLAGPAENANTTSQLSTAILITRGNKPILVNGANAVSAATILTGAAIETPDKVGAVINLPGHFSLEIDPNAKLTMEFDPNGITVTLIHGCIELHTKKGTRGEIVNENGKSLGKTDPAKDGEIDTCDHGGAVFPIVGAAAVDTGLAIGILVNRGRNPSPGAL